MLSITHHMVHHTSRRVKNVSFSFCFSCLCMMPVIIMWLNVFCQTIEAVTLISNWNCEAPLTIVAFIMTVRQAITLDLKVFFGFLLCIGSIEVSQLHVQTRWKCTFPVESENFRRQKFWIFQNVSKNFQKILTKFLMSCWDQKWS